MTCTPITGAFGSGFICSRGSRSHMKPCWICGRPGAYQCDAPVGRAHHSGQPTCDRWLCAVHRVKGEGRDTDYCPVHAKQFVMDLR